MFTQYFPGDRVVWPGHHAGEPNESANPMYVVSVKPYTSDVDALSLAASHGGPVILVVASTNVKPYVDGMTVVEANKPVPGTLS